MSTAVLDAVSQNHPAVRALREAQAAVESIKNDAPQQFPEAASVGDAVRQGDIYIQLIDTVSQPPFLYRRTSPTFPLQLADGNTKGSRHCLAHGNGVTVYQPVAQNGAEMLSDVARQFGIKTSEPDWTAKLRDAEWADRRAGIPSRVHSREAASMLGFAGPIFCLTETNTVTHPEHGDWILPPGSYRVTYQRTVSRENTIMRVLD